MTMFLSLLVAVIGVLVYALCNAPTSSKLAEIGRIAFFCGLLAFLLQFTPKIIELIGR